MKNLKLKTTIVAFAMATGSVFAMPFLTGYISTDGASATAVNVSNMCGVSNPGAICKSGGSTVYDTAEHAVSGGALGVLRMP